MLAFLAAAWLGAPVSGGAAPAEPAECKVVLNDIEGVLDGDTRAVRRLSCPGPRAQLEAKAGEAGLVDDAHPIPEFEPLRLAARHGAKVSIGRNDREVAISIPSLAPSRPLLPAGSSSLAAGTIRCGRRPWAATHSAGTNGEL